MTYGLHLIKYANVAATSDGDNALIAAVANKRLRIVRLVLEITGAGNAVFRNSDDTGTFLTLTGVIAPSFLVVNGSIEAPVFETGLGLGLEVNNAAGVDVVGGLAYYEV